MTATPPDELIHVEAKSIPVSSVEVVIAELGLDFRSSKTRACWGRNVIIANGKKYLSRCAPEENAHNFEQWLTACPKALGIMIDGTLRLPRIANDSHDDPLKVLSEALMAGKRELAAQFLKSTATGLTLMLVGTSVVSAVALYGSIHPFAKGLMEYGAARLVLMVAGLVAGIPGLIIFSPWKRVAKALRNLQIKTQTDSADS